MNLVINDDLDIKCFYKNIKKYKRKSFKDKISITINNKINKIDKIQLLDIVDVINEKDKEKRLSLVYDKACKLIDELYVDKNFCEFKDNKCIAQRIKKSLSINGCCMHCVNLACNGCKIKSLGCKLYFCPYIKKNKECIKLNDIKVLKFFFNLKQKVIIKNSIYETKEESLNNIKKNIILWSFKGIKNNRK